MSDVERWEQQDMTRDRDRTLQAMGAYGRTTSAMSRCRQCDYDRVGIKTVKGRFVASTTCAWCGATGKQRT